MSTAMDVRFGVSAGRMATAMAIVARDSDDLPSYSADSFGEEPPVFARYVADMSRNEARDALRTCFWRYGEGDCWPDDYPRKARERALQVVLVRGWAS
jgi:hypothetical protein